ncbi:MAG: 30S ribosomal protein S20 [Pirellulales bacterium]|nr:30S ribosomal protein S20 [Pirellulales bacterium]
MPNIKSAAKRHRQSLERRAYNRAVKSAVKTQLKKAHAAAVGASVDQTALDAEYRAAVKKLDQAAAKGVIHRNKAARLKSRLTASLKPIKNAPVKLEAKAEG